MYSHNRKNIVNFFTPNTPKIKGGNILEELWKPVENYEGLYEISNFGRVKTIEHKIHHDGVNSSAKLKTVKERIRKPNIMKGYHCIALLKDGNRKVYRIHRLVIEHFGEKQPSAEYQVNHIDGDKSNNRIDNLEWVTPKENTIHAIETGLRPKHLNEETKRKISINSKIAQNKPDRLKVNSESSKRMWEHRKKGGFTTWAKWKTK